MNARGPDLSLLRRLFSVSLLTIGLLCVVVAVLVDPVVWALVVAVLALGALWYLANR